MTSSRLSVASRTLACLVACLLLFQAGETVSQSTPNVAGLVVDYGNGARTYALVPLGDQPTNGIELLDATGLDTLTVGFGGMGVGVCAIETVGCDLAACQGRLCQTGTADSPFWNYLTAPGPAGAPWQFSSLGASATVVSGGDVNAWFWTGTRPSAPAMSLQEIADQLEMDIHQVGRDPVVRTFGSMPPDGTPMPSTTAFATSALLISGLIVASMIAVRRAKTS